MFLLRYDDMTFNEPYDKRLVGCVADSGCVLNCALLELVNVYYINDYFPEIIWSVKNGNDERDLYKNLEVIFAG